MNFATAFSPLAPPLLSFHLHRFALLDFPQFLHFAEANDDKEKNYVRKLAQEALSDWHKGREGKKERKERPSRKNIRTFILLMALGMFLILLLLFLNQ